jgi:hypothetical protein
VQAAGILGLACPYSILWTHSPPGLVVAVGLPIPHMNRADLQLLVDARLADADVLLNAQRWPGAYYLLGYAVECGLKVCAARQFRQDEVPEREVVRDFYTHRLDKLLQVSGVKPAFEERARKERAFQANWNTIRDWNEDSRYDHSTTKAKALDMRLAAADPTSGVLSWLRAQW